MSEKKLSAETPKMGLLEKLGFGCYSMSSNILYQFKSTYYLFFLTNVLGIGIGTAGTVFAIGTVWDAVNDPLLGFTAVNHTFKNGEKIRPFILFALPWAVTIVGLFTAFGGSETAKAVIALLIYFVFETFNTYISIPYNSMGAVATNRDADRRSLNIYRNVGGCFGTAIGAIACTPLLKLFGAMDRASGNLTERAPQGFFYTACLMGVICVVGAFVHFFTTKERVRQAAEDDSKLSFRDVARMLFRNGNFVRNTLYIICYGCINTLLLSCITYYATYVIGSTAAAMPIQTAYLLVSLGMSFFVGLIDRKLGRRKTMILGALFYSIGKIWFLIQPSSLAAMYSNALTVGVAVSISFVMFNTNRNNIVDLVEAENGRRLDSMVSTVDNLASKMATAFVTWLIGFTLERAGFDQTLALQPAAVTDTLNALIGWVPALFGVAMFFVVKDFRIEDETKALAAARQKAQE